MLQVENIIFSSALFSEKFCCSLSDCLGVCCEDGDAGPIITDEEKKSIAESYPIVSEYLPTKNQEFLNKKGLYIWNKEFGWVTPTLESGLCAYGVKDNNGVIKCAFEMAYNDKKSAFKKPISCHLFPIKTKASQLHPNLIYVNYEPRPTLCKPACQLGKKIGLPVFRFLKEALIRHFGDSIYTVLEQYYETIKTK